MLLNREAIKDRQIVVGASEGHYRHAGYDLTVGRIVSITTDGKRVEEVEDGHFELPAHGGMVEVISAERIVMPSDVLGYATPRTTVSREGILALNVGILDPGYQGLISTTLINFSKQPYMVHKAEPFLRVTFHRIEQAPRDVRPHVVDDAAYVRKEIARAARHFSPSFLDISNVAEESASKAFEKYTKTMFVWFPVLLLTLAVLTFVFNFVAPRPPGTMDVRNACENLVDARLREFEQRMAARSSAAANGVVVPPAFEATPAGTAPAQIPQGRK